MPQVEFDGQGDPIPLIALPPFGSDGNLPPATLTFKDSVEFKVSDYRALGFTHFEVWCVGAAGGRGGDSSTTAIFGNQTVRQTVPQDVWNLHLEGVRIGDFYTSGEWDHVYSYGPGAPNGGMLTAPQAEEWQNPNHQMTFETYRTVQLYPQIDTLGSGMGGAGGGGGFQKSSGVLADLTDSVPIVVGKVGADAALGQAHQNGIWTPDITTVPLDTTPAYPRGRQNEIINFFQTYLITYPFPHASFSPPLPGSDGGASSFSGEMCQASGGEGGHPAMVWNGAAFVADGNGGDGGLGGRLLPGGGGAGSTAEGVNGVDGVWHPETGIGAGGGGGQGGLHDTQTTGPIIGSLPSQVITHHLATAGGQGSYSFGDTSVYGERQFRQAWTYQKPTGNTDGSISLTPVTDAVHLVIPGGGGGARPISNLKVGSKAPGYSPDGIVVLRLSKIT